MSRAKRLSTEMESVESAQMEVERLKDELELWLENMPENLQNSAKAEGLQEAIDQLEEICDHLQEAFDASGNVNFPGMF
ncbi:hypothetical protein LCGC14_0538850 [marine sediment metagenome]|uniref:Uncharacterized protein n=1 Tax=marine sediment metagenome TaxID=412755 RepID=A0A0F9RY93_9ZZZZ